MVAPLRKPMTVEDLAARSDSDRLELVGGAIVEKAAPSPDHSLTELKLAELTGPFNRRAGGPRGPGGWWLFAGLHVAYATGEVYCHDAAGWRRDRLAERPKTWPVRDRPDWVCEIVSRNHEANDLVIKPRALHAAEVPHYWVIDPEERILLVHRWSPDGYIVVERAQAGDKIRPEPFEALELAVASLFGDDED